MNNNNIAICSHVKMGSQRYTMEDAGHEVDADLYDDIISK